MRVDAVRRFNRFYTRAHRRAARRAPRQPLSAARGAPALRARPARRVHRERAGRRARARRRLPQPPAAGARAAAAWCSAERSPRTTRAAAAHAHRQGPQGLRAARRALARRGGGACWRSSPRRDRERLVGAMRTVQSLLEQSKKTLGSAAARAPPGRHRLGGAGARRALRRTSTAGASASRRWSPRSPRNSSPTSIPSASAAGSPRWTASASARCSWCRRSKTRRQAAAAAGRPARARPWARPRLVQECIAFARAKGYRKLVLWTQSNLAAARAIYRRVRLRAEEKRAARAPSA